MYPRSPSGRPMPRKLRKRIVAQIEIALANIDAALAGKNFSGDDQRIASLAVLHVAPHLFRRRTPADEEDEARRNQPLWHPNHTEAEADDLMERLEVGETREKSAAIWGEDFRQYGPDPGKFQTLEEAQEYGRKVFDRIQAQPHFIPHKELAARQQQQAQQRSPS